MKYRGLGPVGGAGADGWALAGSDLVRATDLLRDPGDAAARVRLAEVLRRRFAVDAALAVLRGSGPEPTVGELLCLGTVQRTVGDAAAGDDYAALAAAIGLPGAERFRYRRENRRVLRAAVRAGARSTDEHLPADLDRERVAWALLGG